MDIQRIREQFPITKNKVFLNHAATSPLPLCSSGAMKDFVKDKVEAQSTMEGDLGPWQERIRNCRRLFSQLVGAKEQEVAYVPNTTFGLNLIAQMLPYKPGSNVVTNNLEYPSNVIAWLKLEERGVEVHFIKNIDGKIGLDQIEKAVNEKTVALTVGQVGWYHGFRHDLKAISEIAHGKGAYLVVDAIQSAGAMKIDVKREGIDFLACGSYKWLLGPPGAGFLFIREDLVDVLNPPLVGYGSIDPELAEKNLFEYFDLYRLQYSKGIGKYEVAHINDLAYVGAEASMKLLLDYGMEGVEQRIREIGNYLVNQLVDAGYKLQTPLDEKERHAIVNFRVKDWKKTWEGLTDRGIIVSPRMGGIRVSPHFYNTQEEIDRLINALKGAD